MRSLMFQRNTDSTNTQKIFQVKEYSDEVLAWDLNKMKVQASILDNK